ncbi:MAG: hypothetical protein HZB81_02910 [Deltaproteobacteria bacterium]|nr:hypothetical protein [Deltaproteobacteria bacterium]
MLDKIDYLSYFTAMASMDKIELLRYLSNSDFFHLLSNGELKLYVLLLASADAVDIPCKISFGEVEKIGRRLTALKKLKSSITSLEKYGLAVFEKIEEWPYGELKFRLTRPSGLKAVKGE